MYNASDAVKHSLPAYGFLNCHLCFNAEITIEHTECDSLYTIIMFPMQPIPSTKIGNYNRRVGIYLHRNAIVRNGPKVTFAAANVHKASNSIARNEVTSFNVYR